MQSVYRLFEAISPGNEHGVVSSMKPQHSMNTESCSLTPAPIPIGFSPAITQLREWRRLSGRTGIGCGSGAAVSEGLPSTESHCRPDHGTPGPEPQELGDDEDKGVHDVLPAGTAAQDPA